MILQIKLYFTCFFKYLQIRLVSPALYRTNKNIVIICYLSLSTFTHGAITKPNLRSGARSSSKAQELEKRYLTKFLSQSTTG